MKLPRLRGRLKGKRHIVLGAVLGAGVALLASYGRHVSQTGGAPGLTDIITPVVGGLALGAVGAKMVPNWAWAMGLLGGMAGPWATSRIGGVVSGVA